MADITIKLPDDVTFTDVYNFLLRTKDLSKNIRDEKYRKTFQAINDGLVNSSDETTAKAVMSDTLTLGEVPKAGAETSIRP